MTKKHGQINKLTEVQIQELIYLELKKLNDRNTIKEI